MHVVGVAVALALAVQVGARLILCVGVALGARLSNWVHVTVVVVEPLQQKREFLHWRIATPNTHTADLIHFLLSSFSWCILTEFPPAGNRFCPLLLGVISMLALFSQLFVAVALGIRGAPALGKPDILLAGPLYGACWL